MTQKTQEPRKAKDAGIHTYELKRGEGGREEEGEREDKRGVGEEEKEKKGKLANMTFLCLSRMETAMYS